MSRLATPDGDIKVRRTTERRIRTLERLDTHAPGSSGDLSLAYIQNAPALVWTITHTLGKFPSVQTVDSTGALILADVTWPDANTVVVTFSVATAGKAYLN